MRKLAIALIVVAIFIFLIFNRDNGTQHTANIAKLESLKADIAELQGKSMFYKNNFGHYPIIPDNIYDMSDGYVVDATRVFEQYLFKDKSLDEKKAYMAENFKLIDLPELKAKGITYELANKKSKYFLDKKTGMVFCPELIEGDPEYLEDLDRDLSDGTYKVLGSIIIEETDNTANKMQPVQGSFRGGSAMYFYGGGKMKLAVRNEATKVIDNLDHKIPNGDNISEILYIQPHTFRAVMVTKDNKLVMVNLDL